MGILKFLEAGGSVIPLNITTAYYEQKDDPKPKYPRRLKRAIRRANLFIDAEAHVDGDAKGDKKSDDENNGLNSFIVADVVKF